MIRKHKARDLRTSVFRLYFIWLNKNPQLKEIYPSDRNELRKLSNLELVDLFFTIQEKANETI